VVVGSVTGHAGQTDSWLSGAFVQVDVATGQPDSRTAGHEAHTTSHGKLEHDVSEGGMRAEPQPTRDVPGDLSDVA